MGRASTRAQDVPVPPMPDLEVRRSPGHRRYIPPRTAISQWASPTTQPLIRSQLLAVICSGELDTTRPLSAENGDRLPVCTLPKPRRLLFLHSPPDCPILRCPDAVLDVLEEVALMPLVLSYPGIRDAVRTGARLVSPGGCCKNHVKIDGGIVNSYRWPWNAEQSVFVYWGNRERHLLVENISPLPKPVS